jgi:heat shock protein HslJ
MKGVRPTSGARRLAVIIAVATTVGCASLRGGGDAQRLAGADWRLSELSGRVAIPTEVSRRPWLRFATDSGRVTGSGGCNRLTGPFTTDRTAIRFGAIVSTKMACADQALTRQEQDFFSVLNSANRFDVEGDTLLLLRGDDVVARFVH